MGPHEMRDALASTLGSPVDFHASSAIQRYVACKWPTLVGTRPLLWHNANSQRNVAKLHYMQAMIVGNDAMMESLRSCFDQLTTQVALIPAAIDVDSELEHMTHAMRSLMHR